MRKTITQRELRNGGGVPVGELRPFPRREFVPAADVVAAFASAPRIERRRFRRDLDALMDQDLRPRG